MDREDSKALMDNLVHRDHQVPSGLLVIEELLVHKAVLVALDLLEDLYATC